MSIFNRSKKTPVNPSLPPEIQAYSQAERRERMGVAWLVGIVSLVVSLILIVLLFLGGRWVFRKIAQKDKAAPTPVIIRDENKGNTNNKPDTNNSTDDSKPTDTPTSNGTTNTNNSTTPQPTAPTGNQDSTPNSNTTLPNTGPSLDL